ncbi:hypothetical protein O1611_g7607 [Lasiodiplodia mahajangana]|uniref:Uncharacterized protein n=1 Tax=Lasiodiplodia mahajangana TaxID=1108764 RepID=A0ACC2JEV6_9PEZI|nr:hypothetical protein O1611_g7607 [Lasiodiplodia mahajangana]
MRLRSPSLALPRLLNTKILTGMRAARVILDHLLQTHVGTLSALHDAKERHHRAGADGNAKSSVLLATKPRHSSEEALFELLKDQSWAYRVVKGIPVAKIGEEDEVVQIYLLEKGGDTARLSPA